MSRWARVERTVLVRRFAWAAFLSAALHTIVLALVELPDLDAMQRADWPQLDVRFAKLTPRSVSEKPAADAPTPALRPEVFDVAAPRVAPAPKQSVAAAAKTAPRTRQQTRTASAHAPQPAVILAQHVPVPPSPDGDAGASQSAQTDAATTTQAAITEQDLASAFPKALELEYSIQEAEGKTVLGWMVYRFEREGDRYRIRSEMDAIGVASFFVKGRHVQRSEGRLTAAGLQPENFMVRHGRRERVERATFDWKTLRATLTNAEGSREWALQAGAQDQLSVVHQISFLLENRDPPALMVTDGRRFETVRVDRVGRETVQTELGPMETVRIRSDLGRGVIVQLWLAPDFGYLPARLRLRDKRGREAEQVLASVKVQW